MRLILTLIASLLAGAAMAQTGTFGTSNGADGGAEPSLPGTDAVADPDVDAGQEAGDTGLDATGVITDITELPPGAGDSLPDAGLDTGLDATGVITDITDLPPGAGDAGLDAGSDVGLDVGVDDGTDDGFDTMDDGLSADAVDDTASFPVLTAPGAEVTDGEPTVVQSDGPVVVVPAEDGENEPAAAVNDPATRLTEGVDGDVQPKRIQVE